jgi:ADP-ribose pyrophosphatase YjhB (NUDIX family)
MSLCNKCQSKRVSETIEGRSLSYTCQDCGHSIKGPLLQDDLIKIVNTSQGLKHINTVALIRHHDKVLVVEQDRYPYKFELPGDHLRKNETLERALERTIDSLLGLEVTASTLLDQLELPSHRCRYGADIEEWAIFDVTINENELVASNPTRLIAWLPIDKIETKNLTPETTYAFKALGYIRRSGKAERK